MDTSSAGAGCPNQVSKEIVAREMGRMSFAAPRDQMPDDERTCFVISPIGAEGSDVRGRADVILKHIVRPSAEAAGFRAERADEIAEPGMISRQIVRRLLEADAIVADMTGLNANVNGQKFPSFHRKEFGTPGERLE